MLTRLVFAFLLTLPQVSCAGLVEEEVWLVIHPAARAGFRLGVAADLNLVHASRGNYDATWQRYADRFCSKHSLGTTARLARICAIWRRVRMLPNAKLSATNERKISVKAGAVIDGPVRNREKISG